jgi:hypothetical protein
MPRTSFSALRFAALCLVMGTAVGLSAPTADAALPRGDAQGPAIDAPAGYQPQFLCKKTLQPGVKAFRTMVLKNYKRTRSASEVRSCSSSHISEHADGRAWDWGVRTWKKGEKKKADHLLNWLLAPDEFGNDYAMARRLGVMYIIWNKQIWRSYSGEWGPYSCSGPTSCHQDHVHFSFGWAGAYKKTSFWTGSVATQMGPPLPVLDSLTSPWRVTVRANEKAKWGTKNLGAGLLYTVTASGVWKYGAQDFHQADAACRMGKDGQWTRSRALRVSGVWNLVPTIPGPGGCNVVDHTYIATLTPGVTDAVNFGISDDKLKDNSGAVDVVVRRVLALPDLGFGGGWD